MIAINEYFGGAVKSLAYESAEGKSTIGVIEKGEYEFGTSMHETMYVIEGELIALLPGSTEWRSFKKGQSFEINANQSFKVRTEEQCSYLCKYK
ncbi:pyrimidine/purine nucleoside phosphorylase [Daejeonella sp. H1SJ63]|uniref:pyrimidine/purine nucleoside phosphorylase n=1 Tax=Daejeonella sp. H1SJ63 TaxID=3034145 RepID=UPI0023ED4B8F|nr:pyrimidine/purine nucleoside phosphorylase [Daejeonella sp. H1SJ63]